MTAYFRKLAHQHLWTNNCKSLDNSMKRFPDNEACVRYNMKQKPLVHTTGTTVDIETLASTLFLSSSRTAF